MKTAAVALAAILSGAVVSLASPGVAGTGRVAAQAVDPCPVVVENTTLKTDCLGPMFVLADNVTVNLNRHQVVCPAFEPGIIIQGRTNVRIVNGHVHGCRYGVIAEDGGSHQFANLHLDGSSEMGILLRRSHDNLISGSFLSNNGRMGLYTEESNGNRLSAGVVITDNREAGVFLNVNSSGNVIESSAISRNPTGIRIEGGSDNTIRSNKITGNEDDGVTLVQTSGTLIRANEIRGNSGDGVHAETGAVQSVIRDNRVVGNEAGIHLDDGATNNFIAFNTARENATFDLQDDNPGCDSNIWRRNNNITQNQPCID